MVNQGILNYLKEGKRRGFSVELLKQKLLDGGFQKTDINEAINFLQIEIPKRETKTISAYTPAQPSPLPSHYAVKELEQKISTFSKIGKAITHPTELFEKTSDEKIWPALKYYLLILIIPFIAITVLVILFFNLIISFFTAAIPQINLGSLATFSVVSALAIAGFFALIFFIIIPIMLFIGAGILHLFVKIYGGKGDYKDTFRVSVYSSTPSTLLAAVPFLNFAATIWSFVLSIIGISFNHHISKLRAFFAYITITLITGIIYFVFILIFKQSGA